MGSSSRGYHGLPKDSRRGSLDVYDGSASRGRWAPGRWFRRFGPAVLAVVFAIVLTLLTIGRQAWAQGVEESVRGLSEENAQLYIQPVISGLGAALNTGFFHTASVHRPLGFDVGLRAMGAFAPTEAQWFQPVLPPSVTYEGQTFEAPYEPAGGELLSPTPMGPGVGMTAVPTGDFRQALLDDGENPDDYSFRMPDGVDLPAVPFMLLQLSMGLPMGTEVSARLTPRIELGDDVGAISMVGAGLRHSLDQWVPVPGPLKLSVSAGLQRLTVGDYLTLTARHAALVTGTDLGPLSVYGAAGVEGATADVEYLIEDAPGAPGLPDAGTQVSFTQSAESTRRLTGGATLSLSLVKLNAEYSVARYPVLNAKLLVGLR